MIIAMPVVYAVQVSSHEVVDMIAVRDRLMAACGTVLVRRIVNRTGVVRRAPRRVRRIVRDDALVDMVAVRMVQMAFVEVVV